MRRAREVGEREIEIEREKIDRKREREREGERKIEREREPSYSCVSQGIGNIYCVYVRPDGVRHN